MRLSNSSALHLKRSHIYCIVGDLLLQYRVVALLAVIQIEAEIRSLAMRSPRRFWESHVYPDYQDYLQDQGSERKAMHAALSAFHMADHVWTYYHQENPKIVHRATTTNKYREVLARDCCPDFALLRDIAEVHKHMRLDRPKQPPRLIMSSTNVRVENIDGDSLDCGVLGSFVLGGYAVVIDLDDGSKRVFGDVLRNVIEMWERLM